MSRLNGLGGTDVMTEAFPGFATDMQTQFMALMCVADGTSTITETLFENRFMHVPELMRIGARIKFRGQSVIVRGVPTLSGAPVMATDLRASVSLVVAGLAVQGETIVDRRLPPRPRLRGGAAEAHLRRRRHRARGRRTPGPR